MAKRVRTKVKEIELDEFTQFLIKFESVLNRGNGNKQFTQSNALQNANKINNQEIKGDQNHGK